MYPLWALLSLVYLASASPIQAPKYDHTLKQSVDDFVKLIPLKKVLIICLEAISNDDQVKEAIDFMRGPQFRNIAVTVENMDEYKKTLKTLYDLGLDVYYYLNALHDILGIPDIPTPSPDDLQSEIHVRTLIGFFEKLHAVMPNEEFSKMYKDKMQNDDVFIAAMTAVKSPEFNKIGDVVQAMPEWAELLRRLEAKGVDTAKLLDIIKHFFGWH